MPPKTSYSTFILTATYYLVQNWRKSWRGQQTKPKDSLLKKKQDKRRKLFLSQQERNTDEE